LAEYKAGRTPNPDILCNREIKFKAFLDYATVLGADYIATGHYTRRRDLNGTTQLLKGLDANKDQSYFLHAVGSEQLARTLFPVGEVEKPAVRALAEKYGLITHDKKDSTGICFIGERRFKDFLQQYLPAKPGRIETLNGDDMGQHSGLMYHTIGQRQGLGIGGVKGGGDEPWYVIDKDLNRNVLLVAQGGQHPALFKQALQLTDIHWISAQMPTMPHQCTAKTRYRQADQQCEVHQTETGFDVHFTEQQRAITPGQSVVFYDDEVCLGGGIIEAGYQY
jgi:tRNA-specific 2-thiouridylase